MAVTATRVQSAQPPGADLYSITDVTCDNSYASGGEPLSAAQLGLRRVTFAICDVTHGTESGTYRAVTGYYSGGKLHLIDSATGKEVESTKDMSKVVVRVLAFGKP